MTIRATILLPDQSQRYRDFESQEDADQWLSDVAAAGTYGDPSTYDTATADVTAQVDQEQADNASIYKGLAYQQVGAKAIAMLTAVNLEKQITAAQLQQMAGNQMLMLAITLVGNGALKTGRDIFAQAGTTFYSADEIARICRPIDQSGLV